MAHLQDLARGAIVKGVLPDVPVTIVGVKWIGSNVIELTHKDATGRPHDKLVYRGRELTLDVVTAGTPWSLDGEGALFRLAHLFDPLLAVHTSLIDPLPHQIIAVYGEMLSWSGKRVLYE